MQTFLNIGHIDCQYLLSLPENISFEGVFLFLAVVKNGALNAVDFAIV